MQVMKSVAAYHETCGEPLEELSLSNISMNADLVKDVTYKEVHDAVFALDSKSAAGIDGYNGEFFKHCWDIIGQYMVSATQDFMEGNPIPRAIGATMITLIPKVNAPTSFSEYRPISLSTFVNKVFTKLLSVRLQKVLPMIISDEQSAFMQGKDIADNVLLVQEMIQFLHKKTRGHNIVYKFDVMKAFDRVSWSFLEPLLLKFGFSSHFTQLIMNNLKGSWFSLLINGSPAGFFQSSRGIKQGDPISPYLFIIVTEALSRGIKQVFTQSADLYSVPRDFPVISHSLYADDLIMFSNGNLGTIKKLINFLQRYEEETGQKINMKKSFFLIGRRALATTIHQIEQQTQMHKTELPMIYLGCPIHIGKAKAVYFQSLIHKFENKLQGWKAKLLSPGGKMVLSKHVLSAIPINQMAAMRIPVAVRNRLERIISNFLWNDTTDKKRKTRRKWDEISFPYDENGLGFRRFQDIQNSFYCKLWWKLLNRQGLWAIKFMNSSYPLYKLHSWKMLRTTQQCMEAHSVYFGDPFKKWIWKPSSSGTFTVASAHQILRKKRLTRFELGEIWKPYIPSRVAFFLWRLYNNLLPFPNQLMKMGINGPFKCPNCSSQDSMLHFFWQCERAGQVWGHFQALFSFKPNSDNWKSFMSSWILNKHKGIFRIFLIMTFYFTLWEMWKQRCSKVYGDEDHNLDHTIAAIMQNLKFAGRFISKTDAANDDDILKTIGLIHRSHNTRKKKVMLVKWHFPDIGTLKLNCDGSSLGNPGPAGGGGFVVRNDTGKVILAGLEFYSN